MCRLKQLPLLSKLIGGFSMFDEPSADTSLALLLCRTLRTRGA